MKVLKVLGLFVFAGMVLVSCKKDAGADTAAKPVLTTSDQGVTPNIANPTPIKEATEIPTGPLTTIAFGETSHDFGEIMEGEKVTHMYSFTNTGNEALVIKNAKGSCGCTVPDWPREPIAPGASGEIKVVFDSKGKGKVDGAAQSKRVTITANTDPGNTFLTIKGKVKKDPNAAPVVKPAQKPVG